MSLKKIKKLYYSIGDVSEITGLKQYVLRYWETEFTILNPNKNSAGNRIYKDQDIKVIKHIQELLYKKKFTIKGAKQYLKDYYSQDNGSNVIKINKNDSINKDFLVELKDNLQSLVNLIDKSIK